MPLVSVVLPFRGRFDWVKEAIDSVLQQTYQEWELILVDDGSSDDIEQYLTFKDPRIQLLRQENKGPGSARNRGIAVAKGKYIAFLDSDDIFLPQKLELQVLHMELHPHIELSHTSYQTFTSNHQQVAIVRSGYFTGQVYPHIISGCPIATPTVMVKRSALNAQAFPEEVRVGEDIILWTQLARVSEILGIDEPLTKVRLHGANAATDPESQFSGNKDILEFSMKLDENLDEKFYRDRMATIHLYVANLKAGNGQRIPALRHQMAAAYYSPTTFYKATGKVLLNFTFQIMLRQYNILPEFARKPIKRSLRALSPRLRTRFPQK